MVAPVRPLSHSTLAKRAGPTDLFLELTSPLDLRDVLYVRVGSDVVGIVAAASPATNLVLKDHLTREWSARTQVQILGTRS